MNTVKERKEKKEVAYNELLAAANKLGKEKSFVKKANVYNELMGYREDPKYMYVVMVGELRAELLQHADNFVNEGRLDEKKIIYLI